MFSSKKNLGASERLEFRWLYLPLTAEQKVTFKTQRKASKKLSKFKTP